MHDGIHASPSPSNDWGNQDERSADSSWLYQDYSPSVHDVTVKFDAHLATWIEIVYQYVCFVFQSL
jgi:hypothetical protein